MAQNPSNRESYLRDRAVTLLRRLGYSNLSEGLIAELYGELSSADQSGYSRGHHEGHAEGWEDHGRERGCNCT